MSHIVQKVLGLPLNNLISFSCGYPDLFDQNRQSYFYSVNNSVTAVWSIFCL